jgi:hypothetical protein
VNDIHRQHPQESHQIMKTYSQPHMPIYRVRGRYAYRTTGQVDPCNGGEDLQFVREFASHEAALNWLWSAHPVQL